MRVISGSLGGLDCPWATGFSSRKSNPSTAPFTRSSGGRSSSCWTFWSIACAMNRSCKTDLANSSSWPSGPLPSGSCSRSSTSACKLDLHPGADPLERPEQLVHAARLRHRPARVVRGSGLDFGPDRAPDPKPGPPGKALPGAQPTHSRSDGAWAWRCWYCR